MPTHLGLVAPPLLLQLVLEDADLPHQLLLVQAALLHTGLQLASHRAGATGDRKPHTDTKLILTFAYSSFHFCTSAAIFSLAPSPPLWGFPRMVCACSWVHRRSSWSHCERWACSLLTSSARSSPASSTASLSRLTSPCCCSSRTSACRKSLSAAATWSRNASLSRSSSPWWVLADCRNSWLDPRASVGDRALVPLPSCHPWPPGAVPHHLGSSPALQRGLPPPSEGSSSLPPGCPLSVRGPGVGQYGQQVDLCWAGEVGREGAHFDLSLQSSTFPGILIPQGLHDLQMRSHDHHMRSHDHHTTSTHTQCASSPCATGPVLPLP